mmetsp:Transcript_23028/g.53768  ORF Transcript_23028/g.53768 Transcript_23028/m.53768 type:complete len:249 (+) Transcript_23028:100-846(+)
MHGSKSLPSLNIGLYEVASGMAPMHSGSADMPWRDGRGTVGALKAGTRFFGSRLQFGKSAWIRIEEGSGAHPPLFSPTVSYVPPRSAPAGTTASRSRSASSAAAASNSQRLKCRLYEQSMVEHIPSIYGGDPKEAEAVWIKDTGQHLMRLRDAHNFVPIDRQRKAPNRAAQGNSRGQFDSENSHSQIHSLGPGDFPQPAATGLLSHDAGADAVSWARFCQGATMNLRLYHTYGAPASRNCGRWRQLPD